MMKNDVSKKNKKKTKPVKVNYTKQLSDIKQDWDETLRLYPSYTIRKSKNCTNEIIKAKRKEDLEVKVLTRKYYLRNV